ncbi:MAG: hypothetical protein ACI8S6_000520 [Myxococcota bacterium]|jgi:hypothetical protein
MRHVIFAALAALGLVACDDTNACDEYITYVCDCGTQDECDEVSNIYADPDESLVDECAIALDDERSADSEAGEECTSSTDG